MTTQDAKARKDTLTAEYNELENQIQAAKAKKNYRSARQMNNRQFEISNEIDAINAAHPEILKQFMAEYMSR